MGVNAVCNRFTGFIEEGRPLFLPCNPPMAGAFVSVHLEGPAGNSLSICEAFVYTDQVIFRIITYKLPSFGVRFHWRWLFCGISWRLCLSKDVHNSAIKSPAVVLPITVNVICFTTINHSTSTRLGNFVKPVADHWLMKPIQPYRDSLVGNYGGGTGMKFDPIFSFNF